ncbi:MAG: aminodeoxychorismate/anthranilate synthase component II [archaeon]
MKVLFVDNFDSFTFNLVDEFEKRGCSIRVYRNNISMEAYRDAIEGFRPDLLVISPGPSSPKDAGNSIPLIRKYHDKIPLFGVCLGHQAIVEAFGGVVGHAPTIIHGKPSRIFHNAKGIFSGLGSPFQAGRYHSLSGLKIPGCLDITAETEDKIVMAVQHKKFAVCGVQFHPESILTPVGGIIIENLIRRCPNGN